MYGPPATRHSLDAGVAVTSSGADGALGSHLRQRSITAAQQVQQDYESPSNVYVRPAGSGWAETVPESAPSSSDHYSPGGRSFVDTGRVQSQLFGGASRSRYGALSDDQEFANYEQDRYRPERDDALHEPGPKGPRAGYSRYVMETEDFRGSGLDFKGFLNLAMLAFLVIVLIGLFAALPVVSHYTDHTYVNTTSYIGPTPAGIVYSGVINGTAPNITNRVGPIDPDTDSSFYTKTGADGTELTLVFSDEFNTEGRTFYPDEDPYWEAVNLHYWQTGDLEWYDPQNAITKGGFLELSLTKESNATSHGLGYLGGMMQSWNKFCFTGGRVEVAVSLPGNNKISGFWPAVWAMGNLGRAGYGASLEGTWPYAYDSCDIGTLANQTDPTTGGPACTTTEGDVYNGNSLSYLPGQRLSRCTCPGESHPGPVFANGTFKGRAASEIDFFEATASSTGGQVSQSYQLAPFDPHYYIVNDTTDAVEVLGTAYNAAMNTYLGGAFQEAASALSDTNATTYNSTKYFSTYGVDYQPTYIAGPGSGYIYWLNEDQPMWRLGDSALVANNVSLVSQREVTGEPMSLIANLGMSESFTTVNLEELIFPGRMRIDFVRIYQPADRINIGCNPPLYPTADYIAEHALAYNNQNLTTWADYLTASNSTSTGFPKNRLIDTC